MEAFPIRIKAEERLRGGTFAYPSYQTVLVKARVDGVEGWGEAMTRFDLGATALMVRFLGKMLEGKEHPGVDAAWEVVWKELRVRGHTRGTDVEALSGIEIALQDSLGRAAGAPLSRTLSDAPSERVPVFAGSIFESRGPFGPQVDEAKSRGMGGAKVKVGFGVDEDLATLSAVRRAWEDGMLVADANGAYDQGGAARACAAFAPLGLAWFEEPVPSDDFDGYRSLRGSKTKIGAGESWFAGDFEVPLIERLVDVVEPSVSRCGGLKTETEVARRAEALGVSFSPMTGMNSAVSLAASLHAASAFRSVGVEFNPFANPLQTELAHGIEDPAGGGIRVPTGPGLGIEVDERFVRTHLA